MNTETQRWQQWREANPLKYKDGLLKKALRYRELKGTPESSQKLTLKGYKQRNLSNTFKDCKGPYDSDYSKLSAKSLSDSYIKKVLKTQKISITQETINLKRAIINFKRQYQETI